MKGKLYLVATPIGNFKEITLRAIDTLNSVDYIYAEDTRVSIKLLNHFNIKTQLKSYYLKNLVVKKDEILANLLSEKNIAIISDAGLPLISDPGYEVVLLAKENNIRVIPVGGVSAITSALIASGLPSSPFLFLGFLPRKENNILKILNEYLSYSGSIIILESPNRILKTLNIINKIYGNIKCSIAREISKLYEEIITDNVLNIINLLNERENILGEFVIIINKEKIKFSNDNLSFEDELKKLINLNLTNQEIKDKLSKMFNMTKKDVYNLILKEKNK